MAADKQATNNNCRMTVTKIKRLKDGSIAGISGNLDVGLLVLAYIEGGEKPVWLEKDDFPVIIFVKPDRTIWGIEKYLNAFQIEEKRAACGSGRDFALAAMACGKTAQEAVELASQFDCSTGMGIDTLML